MRKLGLGTIGTSWITQDFINAALASGMYELVSVYSRSLEKGKDFTKDYGLINIEDDLSQFLENDEIEVVYIASPNSLHYTQSLQALNAGKHVIVEKPASTTVAQWDEMVKVAKDNNVFVFEAAKHLYSPNLEIIADSISNLGEILGASFSYIRYSSKYDDVRAGNEPNVFSLKFAGGALMDLGIYPVYTAVALFGEPISSHYFAKKLHTGVDGIGTIILQYQTFDVTILVGKIATSKSGAEIFGEDETLMIDHVSHLGNATLVNHKTREENKLELVTQDENTMIYEATEFAKMINEMNRDDTLEKYHEITNIARIVSGILQDLRLDTNIVFEADSLN